MLIVWNGIRLNGSDQVLSTAWWPDVADKAE